MRAFCATSLTMLNVLANVCEGKKNHGKELSIRAFLSQRLEVFIVSGAKDSPRPGIEPGSRM